VLIISDNSAVSALAEIGMLEILPALFGRISITKSVSQECRHPHAPAALRHWINHPPGWLTVEDDPQDCLPETSNLGAGEATSISLAWQHRGNCRLILDEKRGRRVAAALGLPVIGIISILGLAAQKGLIQFPDSLQKLKDVHFHFSESVVQEVKRRYGLTDIS
jgi:predicted nucleic acid-binding protein